METSHLRNPARLAGARCLLAVMSAGIAMATEAQVLERTSWLHEGRFGVSTHYFPTTPENIGPMTDGLDVDRLAGQIAETGAAWFVLPVHHQPWLMMSPNATYDRILGHGRYTADRDLPADLSAALATRRIRLVLYLNLRLDHRSQSKRVDPQIQERMGGWPPNDAVIANIADVYREWSLRYGKAVSGWWIDGAWIKEFKRIDAAQREAWFGRIAASLREGNPGAAVAFNPGVDEKDRLARYTIHNDYLAGESDGLSPIPAGRWLDGAQWHQWTYLGNWWGCSGTRFTEQGLAEYGRAVAARGGALTFDIGTLGMVAPPRDGRSRDGQPAGVPTGNRGSLEPPQIRQLESLARAMRGVDPSP